MFDEINFFTKKKADMIIAVSLMEIPVRHWSGSKHFMYITNLPHLYNNHIIQVRLRKQGP